MESEHRQREEMNNIEQEEMLEGQTLLCGPSGLEHVEGASLFLEEESENFPNDLEDEGGACSLQSDSLELLVTPPLPQYEHEDEEDEDDLIDAPLMQDQQTQEPSQESLLGRSCSRFTSLAPGHETCVGRLTCRPIGRFSDLVSSTNRPSGPGEQNNPYEANQTIAIVNPRNESSSTSQRHFQPFQVPHMRPSHHAQGITRSEARSIGLLGIGNLDNNRSASFSGINCVFSMAIDNVQENPQTTDKEEVLEHKINEILFCVVCLELPNTAIYQCKLGHIMCEPCLLRVLANARLRHESARCPGCRIDISFDLVSRNLAVEAISSELPSKCKYCLKKFPSKFLDFHMKRDCLSRPSECKYNALGCPWAGCYGELSSHEENCNFANMTGREIIEQTKAIGRKIQEENNTLYSLFHLLDSQRIVFTDIKLLLCIDENDGTSYFETPLFAAFNVNWIVRAIPDLASEHPISYQVVLKSSVARLMSIKYMALKGPFPQFNLKPVIYSYTFGNECSDSPMNELPVSFDEGIRLLARSLSFHMRLLMFG